MSASVSLPCSATVLLRHEWSNLVKKIRPREGARRQIETADATAGRSAPLLSTPRTGLGSSTWSCHLWCGGGERGEERRQRQDAGQQGQRQIPQLALLQRLTRPLPLFVFFHLDVLPPASHSGVVSCGRPVALECVSMRGCYSPECVVGTARMQACKQLHARSHTPQAQGIMPPACWQAGTRGTWRQEGANALISVFLGVVTLNL